MDWLSLNVVARVLIAVLFCGMTFFMAFFAPMVFRSLSRDVAASFMRALFPKYFFIMGVVAVLPLAVLLPFPAYRPEGFALTIVAGLFFAMRFMLLPTLEPQRAAGHERASGARHPAR